MSTKRPSNDQPTPANDQPTPANDESSLANDEPAPATTSAEAGATKTARTIRDALRAKAQGTSDRGGANLQGGDQKPPKPPYGTRRSMGKR